MTDFAIVGAGIAGLSCAIALQNLGYKVTVFEAAPEIKPLGAGLSLAANAIRAFDFLGVKKEIISAGHAVPYFNIYNNKGKLLMSTNSGLLSSRFGIDNFLIHRSQVHQILLNKVGIHNCICNKKLSSLEQSENGVTLYFQDGSTYSSQYLIAADGIHSAIRKQLLPKSKLRYSGYTCWRAVIDNANTNISEVFETWGSKGRFGLAQLADSKLYWYACINAAQNSALKHYNIVDLQQHFKGYHHPIPEVLAHTATHQLIWNDIIDLNPINRYHFGRTLLVGDAAHATTPNMGQGACQAIEDAATLQLVLHQEKDIAKAFALFEQKRLPRTHFIVNNSWNMGKMAQLNNRFAISIRNTFIRAIPPFLREQQFEKLYNVHFV